MHEFKPILIFQNARGERVLPELAPALLGSRLPRFHRAGPSTSLDERQDVPACFI